MSQRWNLKNNDQWNNFVQYRANMLLAGKAPVVEFVDTEISPTQFNSLHQWLGDCADHLNNAGLDMRLAISKRKASIDWTKESFKAVWYKPLLDAIADKGSTKEQTAKDVERVESTLRRHFSTEHGIQLPHWPTRFGNE
jgi:hypothetical protein